MSLNCWVLDVSGEPVNLDPLDRGLAYGDGLFESMRIHEAAVPRLEWHLRRLHEGLDRIGLAVDIRPLIRARCLEWVSGVTSGVLKLQVTRGVGGRGYLPPADARPTLVISVHALPVSPGDPATQGVSVCIPPVRLSRNPLLAGMKHLNRLEQVMARDAIHRAGCVEGLLFDTDGWLVEGCQSNVFLVQQGRLVTPALSQAGVKGVMRERVMDWCAREGMPVVELSLDRAAVLECEELWLCNSIQGHWPVVACEGREWPIGRWVRECQAAVPP